jgi:hypothetical protein
MVLRREDPRLVRRVRLDVKDPRFCVVDPDDGMSHGLILTAKSMVAPRDVRCYMVGVLDDAATSRPFACFRQ